MLKRDNYIQNIQNMNIITIIKRKKYLSEIYAIKKQKKGNTFKKTHFNLLTTISKLNTSKQCKTRGKQLLFKQPKFNRLFKRIKQLSKQE